MLYNIAKQDKPGVTSMPGSKHDHHDVSGDTAGLVWANPSSTWLMMYCLSSGLHPPAYGLQVSLSMPRCCHADDNQMLLPGMSDTPCPASFLQYDPACTNATGGPDRIDHLPMRSDTGLGVCLSRLL